MAKNKIPDNIKKFLRYSEDEFISNQSLVIEYLSLVDLQREEYWHGAITIDVIEELTKEARFFKENGYYTLDCMPDSKHKATNADKEYWERQVIYCLYGRFIKGIYFPGYLYFYLNFCKIDTSVPNPNGIATPESDFPRFWVSDLNAFHYIELAELSKKNGGFLKKRRSGYTTKFVSMLARNFYHIPGSKQMFIATSEHYLDNAVQMLEPIYTHNDLYTGWKSIRGLVNNNRSKVNTRQIKTKSGATVVVGTKSSIKFVNVTKSDNVRGAKARLIVFEEFGDFKGGSKVWTVTDKLVRENGIVAGAKFFLGTGGTIGEGFDAMNSFFSNPKDRDILSVENIFDPDDKLKEIAYFLPAYYGYVACMDECGYTDIEKAKEMIMQDEWKIDTANEQVLMERQAEMPFIPKHALGARTGTVFNAMIALKALYSLELREDIPIPIGSKCGYMTLNRDNKAEFIEDDTLHPILEYPLPAGIKDKKGAVIIYKDPEYSGRGELHKGRYLVGVDAYAQDDSDDGSLYAVVVFDRYEESIVAEYVGHRGNINIDNEIALLLTLYYNAFAVIERNVQSAISHFKNRKYMHHVVMDSDMSMSKTKMSGKYGISMQASPIRDSYNFINSIMKDSESLEGSFKDKCPSIRGLQELSVYDGKMNADWISAYRIVVLFHKLANLVDLREYDEQQKNLDSRKTFNQRLNERMKQLRNR